MDNLISRPADKMNKVDFSFKIPKAVTKPVPKRNPPSFLAQEASSSTLASTSSMNFSIPKLGNQYRGSTANFFPQESSSSSTADGSMFKIPRLGNQYRNNASRLHPLEASTSTTIMPSNSTLSVRDSLSSLSSGKNIFSSGLDIVKRGTFGKNSFSNNTMGQQLMLPDSSRTMELTNDDNQSLAGSVMSMASNMSIINSFKHKLKNRFESIENILKKNLASDKDRFFVEMILKREQEAFYNEMQREFSMAMSFRDVDACSMFNDTAKTLCGLISKNQSQTQNMSAIKSGKDILMEIQNTRQTSARRHEFQFITKFETSRVDGTRMLDDGCDENDDTVLFRKPKVPKIMVKKMQITDSVVFQKKQTKGNQSSKDVIYLQKWFPVAVGADLKLSGMNKEKQAIETKAIKKRIDNRTVELIDGKKCVIEGSPNTSIVSSFPSNIIQKLKNGLHTQWRVLQKDISNCQRNFRSIPKSKSKDPDKNHLQIECTPRTRKTAEEDELPRKKKHPLNSPLNRSTPVKARGTEKTNDKSLTQRQPVVMIDKNEINKASKPKKISPGKKTEEARKISPNKKTEEAKKYRLPKPSKIIEKPEKVSPKKVAETENHRSRSGRTIKPMKSLWTDGSYIFNVNRKSPVKTKSNDGIKIVNRDSLDSSRKRKRDDDNSNENETKPAKLKKNSPEEKKKPQAPAKKRGRKKKISLSPKEIPKRKSPVKAKSPEKKISPLKISPVKKRNNQISKTNKKIQEKNNSTTASDKRKKANYSPLPEYDEFECADMLDDIELPQISAEERKAQLSKSQLRIASMETPPLQYFSQNLRVLNTATPHQSPEWQISQHSQSAVRRFEERRAKTFKQKIPSGSPAPLAKNIRKSPRIKDLKTITDWIGDKDVKSPKKRSKLINVVIPSRRQLEEDDESESE